MANSDCGTQSHPSSGEPARNLAHNLLQLRKKRNLSQAQLSALSKIPRSTLTYFESGTGNPSLENLSKLSLALQVPIEELLSAPRLNCVLLKAHEAPQKLRAGTKIIKLLPESIPGMEIDHVEIPAAALVKGVPHIEGSREYFYCWQGTLKIRVHHEEYLLEKGDILSFPGAYNHSYENLGRSAVVGLSLVLILPFLQSSRV